jgi:hypothetical protein
VRKNKQLASYFVAVFAVATLAGTSAFAEDRHQNETRNRGNAGGVVNRGGGGAGADVRSGNASQNASPRGVEQRGGDQRGSYNRGTDDRGSSNRGTYDRGNAGSVGGTTNIDRERVQTYDRRNDNRNNGNRNDGNRNDGNRNGGYDRNNGYNRNDGHNSNNDWRGSRGGYGSNRGGSYGNRQPYYAHGRVSRIDPWNGGYRVYVSGAPYPFFVSDSYYRRNRWRVGISISLGGIYNPLGYYDYYDGYNDGYDGRAYSAGALRGVVESVDFRRDTFVIRNEATGSFVTVAARNRRDSVRPGDYVELSGDWTRSGLFDAYRIDLIDDGYRR